MRVGVRDTRASGAADLHQHAARPQVRQGTLKHRRSADRVEHDVRALAARERPHLREAVLLHRDPLVDVLVRALRGQAGNLAAHCNERTVSHAHT